MDSPLKLATKATQDKEKQNKNTTQYVLDTTMCKQTKQKHYTICVGHHYVQTNTNNVNKTSSF